MAGRSTSGCGVNTFEAQTSEIEFVDERFNDSHRVVFANVVVQALGQQCDLGSILAFDESLHVMARSNVATIRATGLKPSTRFYTAWTQSGLGVSRTGRRNAAAHCIEVLECCRCSAPVSRTRVAFARVFAKGEVPEPIAEHGWALTGKP